MTAIVLRRGATRTRPNIGLDAVFPAVLLGTVAAALRSRDTAVAAILGAVLAVVLVPVAPAGVPFLAAFLSPRAWGSAAKRCKSAGVVGRGWRVLTASCITGTSFSRRKPLGRDGGLPRLPSALILSLLSIAVNSDLSSSLVFDRMGASSALPPDGCGARMEVRPWTRSDGSPSDFSMAVKSRCGRRPVYRCVCAQPERDARSGPAHGERPW